MLHSDGTCRSGRGRAEELGTVAIPSESGYVRPFSGQQYECWEGTARSEPVTVEVVVPQGEQDEAVREWLGDPPKDLVTTRRELIERFPDSQYTYAAVLAANRQSPIAMQEAMTLQPENPLNSDVLGAWAFYVLAYSAPCREKRLAEPLETPIADLPVSEPVKAWLEQEKQRMIDECPKILERRRQLEEHRKRRHDEGDEKPK